MIRPETATGGRSHRGALSVSAHEIMAANPSRTGWLRHESRACRGRHTPYSGQRSGLIYWRRRRDLFDDEFRLLTVQDDPPMYIVEMVGTGLCVTDYWVRMQRMILSYEVIRRDIGQLFTISPGPVAPGMTITLTAANGSWIWIVTEDKSPCCGGYTARWPD